MLPVTRTHLEIDQRLVSHWFWSRRDGSDKLITVGDNTIKDCWKNCQFWESCSDHKHMTWEERSYLCWSLYVHNEPKMQSIVPADRRGASKHRWPGRQRPTEDESQRWFKWRLEETIHVTIWIISHLCDDTTTPEAEQGNFKKRTRTTTKEMFQKIR